ncbi:MAG TPA: DAHL domain-containing protein [Polyangiaceae bacterium]
MSPALLLRATLALSVAGFLGLLGYSLAHAIDHARQAEYAKDLRRLPVIDSGLDEAVLKARSGLLKKYDPLVSAMKELGRLHAVLAAAPSFMSAEAARELSSQVAASKLELQRKEALVETFKMHNAVLQNSLHYFPVIANSVIDRSRGREPELSAAVQSLIGGIMLFDVTPEEEPRSRVIGAQSEIKKRASRLAERELARDVEVVLAHSSMILDRKPIVDGVVEQLLGVPTGRSALRMEEAYSKAYRAATDAELARRQALFALAFTCVVLGLLDVLLRIRRSARALELATAELRVVNHALGREREKERQLGELKSRFVSMTSHEFRTPLAAIASSAELLQSYGERWDAERRSDHLSRIRSAAGSMTRMLEDILVIGRAEAGVLKAAPAPLQLDAFCKNLVESLGHASERSHAIDYRCTGDPVVVLDERLLSHVLGNLLSNALKYSPAGSAVLFEAEAKDGGCRFVIADHGIGIPREDQKRLFTSFYRASNVGQLKGSGLGLAVVKRSLDVQNGTIDVQSDVGHGARFEVMIPRQAPVGQHTPA